MYFLSKIYPDPRGISLTPPEGVQIPQRFRYRGERESAKWNGMLYGNLIDQEHLEKFFVYFKEEFLAYTYIQCLTLAEISEKIAAHRQSRNAAQRAI